MTRKTSRGRQRIPLARIQNERHRQITFSKRRSGLFNKVGEISALCGVEAGVVAFSPSGKPFSCGSPDVNHVINRFENDGGVAPPNGAVVDLQAQMTILEDQLEEEKTRGEALDCLRRGAGNLDSLGLPELERLAEYMEELKRQATEMMADPPVFLPSTGGAGQSSVAPFFPGTSAGNPFAAGPSSVAPFFPDADPFATLASPVAPGADGADPSFAGPSSVAPGGGAGGGGDGPF